MMTAKEIRDFNRAKRILCGRILQTFYIPQITQRAADTLCRLGWHPLTGWRFSQAQRCFTRECHNCDYREFDYTFKPSPNKGFIRGFLTGLAIATIIATYASAWGYI